MEEKDIVIELYEGIINNNEESIKKFHWYFLPRCDNHFKFLMYNKINAKYRHKIESEQCKIIDDVLNDIVERIKRNEIENKNKLEYYINSALYFQIMNRCDELKKDKLFINDVSMQVISSNSEELMIEKEEINESEVKVKKLKKVFNILSPLEQNIIKCRYYLNEENNEDKAKERHFKEIAIILELPADKVRNSYYYALEKLFKSLSNRKT